MSEHDTGISIWFFVGIMLAVYGVMITGAGVYGLENPPEVVLASLHADLWWGLLLLAAGAGYLFAFFPRKK